MKKRATMLSFLLLCAALLVFLTRRTIPLTIKEKKNRKEK